ncbi:MAG: T9SS type A sorting domain-containing protein [Flavobacteriales bacterium]
MDARYSAKPLIALLFSVVMAHGLMAQQIWTLGNKGGPRHALVNPSADHAQAESRGVLPVNDECDGAVVVDLAIDATVVRTGDHTGATDSYGFGNDVWEAFTITECADVTVDFCGNSPTWAAPLPRLFVGCTPLENFVLINDDNISLCPDGNFIFTFRQLTPGTYYYAVSDVFGATGPYQITLSAVACSGAAPVNDDCANAVVLTPNPVCTPVDGDVAGATISGGSIPGNGCGGSDPSDDVWYSFIATSTDHSIVVDPSAEMDVVIELRDGTCASSTVIGCQDVAGLGAADQLDATGLTIGTTYFVRVYDWYAGVPRTTPFSICVMGPAGCAADAGTITADASPVCLVAGSAEITATPDDNSIVPAGYETIYVLTQGVDLVIMAVDAAPVFTVASTGDYTIHTLVYDPLTLDPGVVEIGVTTAFDVSALLLQGGGTICGSLDMPGAAIMVQECLPCDANAGALTADVTPVCLDGIAALTATPDGNAVVPSGFETTYLLTKGVDLVILSISATPEFSTTQVGDYTIHTLVYDPNTLDLSFIELGVTTGFEVNGLLIQGGGVVCASLDVTGAPITVQICVPCDADAGTITADASEACLVGGSATISATPDGNANVPAGFLTVYALTQGPELLIINASLTPSFDVTAVGDYTIHTLVYDPNTLDLGLIEFGVTTGFDVNALLIQGGGDICASLDVTGAPISVSLCITCDQSAGAITADATPVCLVSGAADISATPDGNSVVPVGYETIYVLTQGVDLVIIGTDAAPAFSVPSVGLYTIHTLVYDPLTLDLGIIEPGVTTGADVNALLVQGGGTICASLDLAGAPIEVLDCTPANDDCANATALVINAVDDCPGNAVSGNNTYASQDGVEPGCDTGSLAGYVDVWYTFNSGLNTSVTINLDPGTMEDWAVTVTEGCGGSEVYCEVNPAAPIELTTTVSTTYVVRVYSNLDFGVGGGFTICVTGAEPTIVCDGGSVHTLGGLTDVTVCQDVDADVVEFATSSISAESYAFVLTDASDLIVTVLAGNSLDFNSAPLGMYRVWGISYNGDLLGADPGADIATVTSTGACIALSSDFVTVIVEICDGIVEGTDVNWNIYPNPGNGDFTLSYSGADASTVIEVIDMGGRTVHQERVAMVRGQKYPIALGGQLAQGIYSVRLMSAVGSATLRMTVR